MRLVEKTIKKNPTETQINWTNIIDGDLSTFYNITSSLYFDYYGLYKEGLQLPSYCNFLYIETFAKLGSNNEDSIVSLRLGYNTPGGSFQYFLDKTILDRTSCEPQFFSVKRTAEEIASKIAELGIENGNLLNYLNSTAFLISCRIGPTTALIKKCDIELYEIYCEVTYEVPYYMITATAAENGTVTGSGEYEAETAVTLKAIPDKGYKFSHWSDGSTSANRTITATKDLDIEAYFVLDKINNIFQGILQPDKILLGSTQEITAVYTGEIKIYG